MDLKIGLISILFLTLFCGTDGGPKLTHPAFTTTAEMTVKVIYW